MYIWINDLALFEALTGGAFDHLNWQHSGEFDQNFSQKSNAPVFARTGGGWAVLEMTGTLSSSWKIHVERSELKMTDVLFSLKLQCSCVQFTGEAMLCHGPGWGGRVLKEFLGGDMPLRSWNPLVIPEQAQLNFSTLQESKLPKSHLSWSICFTETGEVTSTV